MTVLADVDWPRVRAHYDERVAVHEQLLAEHAKGPSTAFARLLVGDSQTAANYSAAQHGLGPKILKLNANIESRLHSLAQAFIGLKTARQVPDMIRAASMSHLQIGVGSEMSCMMNPAVCWVANSRSIWMHLVVKHPDRIDLADEELRLYRDADESSKMDYLKWKAIHAELDPTMTRIAEEGERRARAVSVSAGSHKFLWADAIASNLYGFHHD